MQILCKLHKRVCSNWRQMILMEKITNQVNINRAEARFVKRAPITSKPLSSREH